MARPESDRVTVRHVSTRRVTPWGVYWRAFNEATRRRERQAKHFATETEAQQHAAVVQRELDRVRGWLARLAPGPLATTTPERVTVAMQIKTFLDTQAPRRKASTFAVYESQLRTHVVPVIGDVVLSALTTDHITLVATTAATNGHPWGMQRNILKTLSACLRWVSPPLGTLLPTNPVRGLLRELVDSNWREPEPNPLTFAQQRAFLAWLQTGTVPADYEPREREARPVALTRNDTPAKRPIGGFAYYYPFFLTLLQTGMRRGEAAALTWDRVFLDARKPYVLVAANYSTVAQRLNRLGKRQYAGDGMVTTKTNRERKIRLSRELAAVLREMARTRRAVAFKERRHASPLVFTRPRAPRPVLWLTVDRVFNAGMIAIGARHENHTVHSLRDTFATVHLERGTALAWVSEMLGHSKRSTTLDRYTKWVPQAGDDEYAETMSQPASGGFGTITATKGGF